MSASQLQCWNSVYILEFNTSPLTIYALVIGSRDNRLIAGLGLARTNRSQLAKNSPSPVSLFLLTYMLQELTARGAARDTKAADCREVRLAAQGSHVQSQVAAFSWPPRPIAPPLISCK